MTAQETPPADSRRDSGAALLSVLMMVAAMSVAALIAVEAIARASELARLTRDRAEAHWLARSGESVGAAVVSDLLIQTEGKLYAGTPGLGEVMRFPLERGLVSARVREATNCFNLNAIAQRTEEGWDAGDDALASYTALLTALGLSRYEADQLANSLADWIDSDTLSRGNGAEDAYYSGLAVPYRTAGGPLSGVRELRAIGPYTPDTLAMVLPLVCARPSTQQSVLNINTLEPQQAPLLSALLTADLEPAPALTLLERRPATGWPTVEAMLAEPELQTLAAEKMQLNSVSLQSDHFLVDGSVTISGLEVPFEYLYGPSETGTAQLVWRRLGED